MNKRLVIRVVIALLIIAFTLFIAGFAALFFTDDYTTRAKVSEGIALAAGPRAAVAEYYKEHGSFPENNEQAWLQPPESISGRFVARIDVLPRGRVVIMFNDEDQQIAGKRLTFEAIPKGDSIEWRCSAADIAERDVPAMCR